MELVESSRKPALAAMPTMVLKPPILNPYGTGLGLPSADSGLGLGFSREARIAQLKADIALASMALESNTSAAAVAVAPRRSSLAMSMDRSKQQEILAALSQTRSLPAGTALSARAPSPSQLVAASAFRAPSPSQLTATTAPSPAVDSHSIQAQLALNQMLLARGQTGAQTLPVDIASLRSTTTASQLEGLKRGLEMPTLPAGDQQQAFKRFKLI